MKPKETRVKRNGLYPPKEYSSSHLYIVDAPDPNGKKKRKRAGRLDPHTDKCGQIRELFEKYTECEVHDVRFSQGTRGRAFWQYWHEELRTKTSDDLVLIFFHGGAGGADEEYKWTLSQYPKIQINAYKFIELITQSQPDSLFLLDCFIQTRFTEKWRYVYGNNEIIARPAKMQDPDGRMMEDDGDFTEAMCEDLTNFVEEINGERKGYKKMLFINHIMADDNAIYSNTLRLWLNKTRYGGKEVVKRFRFDPNRIRANGKLEFLTVIIQGPPEDELATLVQLLAEERRALAEARTNGEESQFDDEGLHDINFDIDAVTTTGAENSTNNDSASTTATTGSGNAEEEVVGNDDGNSAAAGPGGDGEGGDDTLFVGE